MPESGAPGRCAGPGGCRNAQSTWPRFSFAGLPRSPLLAARLADASGGSWLELTRGRHFDSVSVTEALAHELAAAGGGDGANHIGLPGLPFRAAAGDPCDLARRPAGVAISTLTMRHGAAGASFLLHWRDPAKVAHAGGLYQVIPIGGLAFTDDNVARFAGGAEPMQAAGAAVLQLAWKHRAVLLS